MPTTARVHTCGICKEPGHNRKSCTMKKTNSKFVLNYVPLVLYICEFIATDTSYEQLYILSKVSIYFQKAVHFITRKVFEIECEEEHIFNNQTIKYIQPFTQLHKLKLSYFYIMPKDYFNTGVKYLYSLTKLTHLDLSYNKTIPTNVLSYFKKNTNLQHLKISHCMHKINNKSLAYLKYFPNLTYLNVRYNTITNLKFLKYCPNLKILKLDCRRLKDKDFALLASCPLLTSLSLDSCGRITNNGFQHILSLRSLKNLHISYAPNLNEDMLSTLNTLPQINHLVKDDYDIITHDQLLRDSQYQW